MARSPQQDLLIVILLMAALGVAWYYTGGTRNNLAHESPLFSLPGSGGPNRAAYSVPGVELSKAPDSEKDEGPTTLTNYLGKSEEYPSPYAKYVVLEEGNARSGSESEYLIIRTLSSAPGPTTMTGWKLESTATGMSASIPQAATLPFLGSVNSPSPVSMGPGQTAYVVTGRSPNGTSFRTNICTGYFEQFQNFNPGLKLECPLASQEADTYFTTGSLNDECYDIVRSIPRCTLVLTSVPASAGTQCNTFITTEVSYNGCINRHKNDAKFYKDDWYIYIGRDQELWRSRSERIRLLDENGKVVGVVNY